MFLACGYDFVWADMISFVRLKEWYGRAWCLRGELREGGGVVFYYYYIIIL